jgi:hypothetical protein
VILAVLFGMLFGVSALVLAVSIVTAIRSPGAPSNLKPSIIWNERSVAELSQFFTEPSIKKCQPCVEQRFSAYTRDLLPPKIHAS